MQSPNHLKDGINASQAGGGDGSELFNSGNQPCISAMSDSYDAINILTFLDWSLRETADLFSNC
eukprot:5770144-Pyramimonas_sp.AAC.1